MIRKVVEDFCQWLIAAKKESESRVVDHVDWDQVDGLRQKLSTMKSKQRSADPEPTASDYMTDVYRENTALSDRLSIGGRQRGGVQINQQSLSGSSQQIHESLYSGSAPMADDDWSLSQRRSYSAEIYEQAVPATPPDMAAVDAAYFSYATESPNPISHAAKNAAADDSYEPLMIGGMDFSIAPHSDMARLDTFNDSEPVQPAEAPPLMEPPAPSPGPSEIWRAPVAWAPPDSITAPTTVPAPEAVSMQPPTPAPYTVPKRAPMQLPFAVPQPQTAASPLPQQIGGQFDASPSADSTFGAQRMGAPLQIQNIVLRRDSSTGTFDVAVPESAAVPQNVTQDLTELLPISGEADEVADAMQEQSSKPAAYRFATSHQSIADISFGITP
jgi:hypothetical protein